VIDGTAWMEDQGVFLIITVPLPPGTVPRLAATIVRSGLANPVGPWRSHRTGGCP